MPATADVFVGRRLQKQDTRPSGNPAPAFNNEHPRLGSGRWHGAAPRDTQDPVEWFPRALLCSLPSVPTAAAPGIAWHTGRIMSRDKPFQHHGPTGPHGPSRVTAPSCFAGASPRVIRAGVLCDGR